MENKHDKLLQSRISKAPILQPFDDGLASGYPEFAKMADQQMHVFWPWDEPVVNDDVMDLRTKMCVPESHATTYSLKLFTKYEIFAGDEYWNGRFKRTFKRPELKRMSSMFGAVELNSHAPFYDSVNDVLFKSTPEFHSEWKNDPALVDRMDFIGKYVNHKNELLSLASFSFIEGAVLYTTFAYLCHYQEKSYQKNLITNTVSGINMSVADENLHAIGGAVTFRKLLQECGDLDPETIAWLYAKITEMASVVYQHEVAIIDNMYSLGDIPLFPRKQLEDFAKHRCNLCLENLGIPPLFPKDTLDTFIEDWFYKNINSVQLHDFFVAGGKEYNKAWTKKSFGKVWAVSGDES